MKASINMTCERQLRAERRFLDWMYAAFALIVLVAGVL